MNNHEKIEIRFLGFVIRVTEPSWKSIIIVGIVLLLFINFLIIVNILNIQGINIVTLLKF